jgi:twitching motility protein PilI
MAEKLSLRDYQRDLAQRLRAADGTRAASLLALQVGQEGWLVDLADAGEVLPVPVITPVPLTKGWFRGMANIRGNLYSVVDFAAYLGGAPAVQTEQARLLLLGDRFRIGSALLVDRSLGLRNPAQLKAAERPEASPPWLKGVYADEEGRAWKELDVPQLVLQPDYLTVGA